jgi:hypothetical protein
MKRLLITAAMEISLLTLLAACGGDGTDKETPNQERVRKPPHRPPEGALPPKRLILESQTSSCCRETMRSLTATVRPSYILLS